MVDTTLSFTSDLHRPSTRKVMTVHLLMSGAIGLSIGLLVFVFWFPQPLDRLAGGLRIFQTLVAADFVCGPLLTWLLYRPTKSNAALAVDLSLIAAVQLAALGYGMYTLAQSRPLAQVFEVDRFRVVSYADVAEPDLKNLPSWAKPWSVEPVQTMGLRNTISADERLESFGASLSGVDAGQWPSRWQNYSLNSSEVLARSKPLAALRAAHPTYSEVIDAGVSDAMANMRPGETQDSNTLRWLPIVSRSTLNWVVLLDPSTLRIRAYLPLDGFI